MFADAPHGATDPNKNALSDGQLPIRHLLRLLSHLGVPKFCKFNISDRPIFVFQTAMAYYSISFHFLELILIHGTYHSHIYIYKYKKLG